MLLTWEEYRQIANLIEALPGWTDKGPVDRSDWQEIMRLAAALRLLPDREISEVLVVYMNAHPGLGLGPPVDHPYTKPLLLLRVMFEIPAEPVERTIGYKVLREHQVYPAGLFGWGGIAGKPTPEPSLALPVLWDDETGPTLNALRRTAEPFIAGGIGHYQPHLEFRFFRDRFEYRHLEPYLDESPFFDRSSRKVVRKKIATWRELWFQRRLESDANLRRTLLDAGKENARD